MHVAKRSSTEIEDSLFTIMSDGQGYYVGWTSSFFVKIKLKSLNKECANEIVYLNTVFFDTYDIVLPE